MALPASGIISMNDIRIELGISTQAPFDMDVARSGGYVALNPYSPTLPPATGTVSLASWYSYCHACTSLYSFTIYYISPKFNRQGYATQNEACAHLIGTSSTFYSSSSTLSVGSSLYYLSGGIYYPATFSDYAGLWIWNSATDEAILMTSSSSNIIAEIQSCAITYYYYVANFWIDCAGVTTYGVVIRSGVPITDAWSRDAVTGGYFQISYATSGPSYGYITDDTQNPYCGY